MGQHLLDSKTYKVKFFGARILIYKGEKMTSSKETRSKDTYPPNTTWKRRLAEVTLFTFLTFGAVCLSLSLRNGTDITREAGAYGSDCIATVSCSVSGFFDGGTANGGTGNTGAGSSGVRPPVMLSISITV